MVPVAPRPSSRRPAVSPKTQYATVVLGLQSQSIRVARTSSPDFGGALEQAKNDGTDAVVVISTPVTTSNRRRIVELATKHRLPTLSPRDHADSGALISYGTGFSEMIRSTAVYVDEILKGAKPGDLPVKTVRQHELILNLKTSREIGITVPLAISSRASQVIQ